MMKDDDKLFIENGTSHIEIGIRHAFEIQMKKLQKAFRTTLTTLDIDLLYVLASIAYADRRFRRGKKSWSRDMKLTIPVVELSRWRAPEVLDALIHCLHFATGDNWRIDFFASSGYKSLQQTLVSNIPPDIEPSGIILYSGGVDSGATLYQWKQSNPKSYPLPIGIESSSQVGNQIRESLGGACGDVVHWKVHLSKLDHPEPTYRTRTLIYMAAGAVAARLGNMTNIIVSENGQGSLGPFLVPFGDEHPYVNNSPLLGYAFSQFIRKLMSIPLKFEYQNIWKTKATLFRECHKLSDAPDWRRHSSCSRTLRSPGKRPCGLCGNCLLRRMAIASCSDINLGPDLNYRWPENAPWQELSAADKAVATHAVVGMSSMAKLAERDPAQTLPTAAFKLSNALNDTFESTLLKLKQFVNEHNLEWKHFISGLPRSSWICKLDEVTP